MVDGLAASAAMRDVMDLEIGDGTAQITKMIIARDKLAASKDIVGPNRTSQDRSVQLLPARNVPAGADERHGPHAGLFVEHLASRIDAESRIQRSGLAFLSDGAQRRRGGGRAPGLQGRGPLWAKLVVAATWSTAVSAMAALRVRRDKAALFQWVRAPPGERSSRKQPEQSWR